MSGKIINRYLFLVMLSCGICFNSSAQTGYVVFGDGDMCLGTGICAIKNVFFVEPNTSKNSTYVYFTYASMDNTYLHGVHMSILMTALKLYQPGQFNKFATGTYTFESARQINSDIIGGQFYNQYPNGYATIPKDKTCNFTLPQPHDPYFLTIYFDKLPISQGARSSETPNRHRKPEKKH